MLWSSVAAVTAFALGVEWLAAPIVGVPAGLWLVASGLVLAEAYVKWFAPTRAASLSCALPTWRNFRLPSMALPRFRGSSGFAWPIPAGLGRDELCETLLSVLPEGRVSDAVRGRSRDFPPPSVGLVDRLRPGSVDGVQTVRIGVDLNEREFSLLVPQDEAVTWLTPGVRVRWVRIAAGQFSAARDELAGGGRIDALVRRQVGGSVFAFFPERAGRPAAWLDWFAELPLSYPGLFPSRFDASQVELAGWNAADSTATGIARELIVVGAVLSRSSGRLKPARLIKDRTLDNPGVIDGASDRAMHALAQAFVLHARRPYPRPAAEEPGLVRAAARLLGVWATTHESTFTPVSREALLSAASEGLEHEPVQVLRLAAAQFAAGQERQGVRSILWARRRLRSAGAECLSEPLPFVQSEIELGRAGGLSLGRILAGLTLLWSTRDEEDSNYLRDDVEDDLRHSGWLHGRANDLELIKRVMNELERARKNDLEVPRSMAA